MQAAPKLNCSVFEIEERPDGPWWTARALAALDAEATHQERQQARRGQGGGYGR